MSSNPTTKPAPSSTTTKMQFSDLYKSPRSPLAKFRHSVVPAPLSIPSADYDSDLLSKDKTKQKEAVKKHLQEKVRTDWEFTWPPPATTPAAAPSSAPAPAPALEPAQNGHSSHDAVAEEPTSEHDNATTGAVPAASATTATPDSSHNGLTTTPTADDALASTDKDSEDGDNSDAESVYSSMSEDLAHYKPRIEWLSDLSDDDEPTHSSLSPFRFDSPESVGAAVRQSAAEKQARRRRAVREEIQWNEGLACFEARRNAWTSAKTMRVRPKPSSPSLSLSSLSPRRLFSRNSPPIGTSPLQQRQSHDAAAAAAVASDGSENPKDGHAELSAQRSKESTHSAASGASARPHRIQTVLPVPPPLLPPNNPMRASITPSVYISLYEKVILHNLTPSCPVNLSDMMRACVTGWKRDGEWPPRPSAPEPTLVAIRKKKRASVGGEGTRRMSLPFLGRSERTDGDDGGGRGIRKSLQRVFGMGGHGVASPAAAYGPGSMG